VCGARAKLGFRETGFENKKCKQKCSWRGVLGALAAITVALVVQDGMHHVGRFGMYFFTEVVHYWNNGFLAITFVLPG
jgi:hypothetical protein